MTGLSFLRRQKLFGVQIGNQVAENRRYVRSAFIRHQICFPEIAQVGHVKFEVLKSSFRRYPITIFVINVHPEFTGLTALLVRACGSRVDVILSNRTGHAETGKVVMRKSNGLNPFCGSWSVCPGKITTSKTTLLIGKLIEWVKSGFRLAVSFPCRSGLSFQESLHEQGRSTTGEARRLFLGL